MASSDPTRDTSRAPCADALWGIMSRKREAQREKRHELARQLGVAATDVDTHHHLQEHARVCRPALRVVAHEQTGGVLRRLVTRPERLVLALWLVDAKGARLLDVAALEAGERRLDKLTYQRPAHFVLVALTALDPGALVGELPGAALTLDGLRLDDASIASAAWEVPRQVTVARLRAPLVGAAVSVRGVGRVEQRFVLPLARSRATVEVEV